MAEQFSDNFSYDHDAEVVIAEALYIVKAAEDKILQELEVQQRRKWRRQLIGAYILDGFVYSSGLAMAEYYEFRHPAVPEQIQDPESDHPYDA